MQKYAKIWTYLHINVKFNKYVKYEQVTHRVPDYTAAVWSGLKYAVLNIFHTYEKNVIICKIWDRSPYKCS